MFDKTKTFDNTSVKYLQQSLLRKVRGMRCARCARHVVVADTGGFRADGAAGRDHGRARRRSSGVPLPSCPRSRRRRVPGPHGMPRRCVCVHAVVLAAAAAMRVPCVRCGGGCAALSLNVVVCAVGRSKAPPTCLKLAPPWVSSGWCLSVTPSSPSTATPCPAPTKACRSPRPLRTWQVGCGGWWC